MYKITKIADRFEKLAQPWQAQRVRIGGNAVKPLEKMVETLEWFRDNRKMNHAIRQSADGMIKIIKDKTLDKLEDLADMVDGKDYIDLGEGDKREIAKLYHWVTGTLDSWRDQFESRYRKPWADLTQRTNEYLESEEYNTKGGYAGWDAAKFYDSKIMNLYNWAIRYLNRFQYLGRSET